MLGEALFDLLRLLVGVNVDGKLFALCVARDLPQPVGRARAHRMRSEPDRKARRAEALDLGEVGANRLLAEAGEATTSVRDVKQHKVDPGCRGRLTGRECLGETEIVELAHGRVAGASHLAVGRLV